MTESNLASKRMIQDLMTVLLSSIHNPRDAVAQFGISGELVITTTGGEVAQDRNGQELTCPGSESMRILRILQMASKNNDEIDYET